MLVLFYAFWIQPTNSSAQIEDGIYSLNYQVNKAGDISASIANDYFAKPAKLFVEDGKMRVQLTVKQSAWITEFSGPHGGNKELSEDTTANTRLVEFAITGINSPTVVKMKVDIDEMNYHHTYSTDFVWNAASLKLLEAAKKPEPVKEEPKAVEKAPEPKKEEVKAEAAAKAVATPAPTPVPAKVEEKPAPVKEVEEPKATEAKPVEEKKEETTEKATEEKVAEEKATEEKVEEVAKEEGKAAEPVAVAAEEEEESVETATLTEETETAAAPAETTKSSSNSWIYIVIALVVIGAGAVFMRKRSSNKAS